MAQGNNTQSRINAARQAGASDVEIFQTMKAHTRYKDSFAQAYKAGATDADIARDLGLKLQSAKPAFQPYDWKADQQKAMLEEGKKAGKTSFIDSVNAAITGGVGGGAAQAFYKASDLLDAGINKATGTNYLPTNRYEKFTQQRKDFADLHNARREANNQGFDWVQLGTNLATELPIATLGRGYQGAKILSKAGAKVAGQNALVGAGIGGAGFAENSDTRLSNTAFGGIGGAAGAAAGEKIGQGIGKAIQSVKNTSSRFSTIQTNQFLAQINQKLDEALRQNGLTLSELSDEIVSGLRQDALKALRSGKDINPTSVARKAVLDRLGLKGTKAQVSGDAKQWQQQAELAKINGAGDPLRDKFIDDNVQLTRLLDEAAKNTKGRSIDRYGAMEDALNAVQGQLGQNKDYIRAIYSSARNADGNDVGLGGADFVKEARQALKDNYATMELPASIHSILKRFEKKPDEFTLGESEAVIRRLNRAYQESLKPDGTASSETYAIGLVRDVLNNRQSQTLQSLATQNNTAAELYQLGRQAHGFNAQQIESMPLLQDAVKGVEPDQLFNKHILKGNVNELSKTIDLLNNVNPQAVNDIKQQVVEFISQKSINSNGQFSPAGMKKALDQITERRLLTMFTPKEFSQIRDIGKAAHYLITQPPHSYVNNSNSGSTLVNYFMQFINKAGVRKLPIIESLADLGNSKQVANVMQPTITGDAIPTQVNQDLIDRLTRAGLITGSNLPNQ